MTTWCRPALIKPLTPIVQFRLPYCALCRKDSLCALRALVLHQQKGWDRGRWVRQGEVGGIARRVTCTWWPLGLAVKAPWLDLVGQFLPWLLGLAVKAPWLRPGGPIHALAAWTGLENATLTLYVAHFWQGRLAWLWAGAWQPRVLTIACSLMSGHSQGHESDC